QLRSLLHGAAREAKTRACALPGSAPSKIWRFGIAVEYSPCQRSPTYEKTLMNQSAVTSFPLTDAVREALAVTLRGADELIPQEEWSKKLARSAATGKPLRIKLG